MARRFFLTLSFLFIHNLFFTDSLAYAHPHEEIKYGEWGINLESVNKDITAGDNFYNYVNGSWQSDIKIRKHSNGAGVFEDAKGIVNYRAENIEVSVLEGKWDETSDEARFQRMFNSYYDRKRIKGLGLQPMQPYFDQINAAQTHEDIAILLFDPVVGGNGIVKLTVIKSRRDTDTYGLAITPGSFLIANPFVFTRQDNYAKDVISSHKKTLANTLKRTGIKKNVKSRVEAIYAFERAIFKTYPPQAQWLNPEKNLSWKTLSELEADIPDLPWQDMFVKADLMTQQEIMILTPDVLKSTATKFRDTPVDVLKDYLHLQFVYGNRSGFEDKIERPIVSTRLKSIGSSEKYGSRWPRARNTAFSAVPDLVDRYYVNDHFSDDTKTVVTEMSENIKNVFYKRVEQASWLRYSTRQSALAKLKALKFVVGGPEQAGKSYVKFDVKVDDLFGNIIRKRVAEHAHQKKLLTLTTDHSDWGLYEVENNFPVATVNAFYSPIGNCVAIPAGFLLSPFYDKTADPAVNYGSLGMTIGHEIGHALDNNGARYDAKGNLRNWWSDEDRLAFDKIGAKLSSQFSTYEHDNGKKIDAELTLGENLSDLVGISVALEAYKAAYPDAPIIDGYTGTQRFFMAYAQAFRGKSTEARDIAIANYNTHSPRELRINVVLRNIDAWYEAFDVTEEHALWLAPEDRVRLW